MSKRITCCQFGKLFRGAAGLLIAALPIIAQVSSRDVPDTEIQASALGTPSPLPTVPAGNPGKIPSGVIPASCGNKAAADKILDCFLDDRSNHEIAGAIMWNFSVGGQPGSVLAWPQWPSWAKQDLRNAFKDTVTWYNGGMNQYPGTLVADPPENKIAAKVMLQQPTNSYEVLDGPTAAWPIYVGHVALNLASEMYGWVPWSLHNYTFQQNIYLLSGTSEFNPCSSDYPGYCLFHGVTPTNAVTTFRFLKQNGLIGATRIDTIARVLEWARQNLRHMAHSNVWDSYHSYWQYWGDTPISRMINGTVTTDPLSPYFWNAPHHWTSGCGGTAGFLVWVLKAAGIPADNAMSGYHQTAWFSGENLYLSHGDDPYTRIVDPMMPAALYLTDAQTFSQWFPANDLNAGDKNVGLRVITLSIYYPGGDLPAMYCEDIANGKDHASGEIYKQLYAPFFSVPYLEQAGLWQKLDNIVYNKGGCSM